MIESGAVKNVEYIKEPIISALKANLKMRNKTTKTIAFTYICFLLTPVVSGFSTF